MSFFNVTALDKSQRVFGLDFIRAVAILLVAVGHAFVFVKPHCHYVMYLIFMDGVDLFFVLSGFLIGTILIRQLEKFGGISFRIIKNFWLRRWLRTLPNYYLVLLLNILFPVILNPLIFGKPSLLPFEVWGKFLIFIQNLYTAHPVFFPEAWSLAVEEWFYLLIPLIIWGLYALGGKRMSSQRLILITVLLVIGSVTLLRVWKASQEDPDLSAWDGDFRKVVFLRLDSIAYGVLGAYLRYYYKAFWERIRNISFGLGVLLMILIQYDFAINLNYDHVSFYVKVFYFSATSWSVLLILPKMESLKTPKATQASRWFTKTITHISLISYSMYLINYYLVLGKLERFKKNYFDIHFPDNLWTGTIFLVIYIFIIIISSTLLYKFFEKPIMNSRKAEL